jgi:23S rRNA pseudouridine1911/1915/1917 synthase
LWSIEGVTFEVAAADEGKRLDRFLAEQIPETSRARIQEWIGDGRVAVDGGAAKASVKLKVGAVVTLEQAPARPLRAEAEEIPLDILYEDDDLVAVNKPAGMIVHAGAGRSQGTLVNALLFHFGKLSSVGGELRPGIVHRLDRFTSGVILAAKHDAAHQALARQFQTRKVRKTYWALVEGDPNKQAGRGRPVQVEGVGWTRLEMPVARDLRARVRMTSRRAGRKAQTDFRVLGRAQDFALVELRIATGRTHQIRVHMSDIGTPVVGDRLYGAARAPAGLGPLERYYLHAREICFELPSTGTALAVAAPLGDDFTELTRELGL